MGSPVIAEACARTRRALAHLAMAAVCVLAFDGVSQAGPTYYVALGDSVTFGTDVSNPSSLVPSYGDQGFVKPLANYYGSLFGGRPAVANLAIHGELSTSFFSGIAPPGWTGREPGRNLNYPSTSTPQNTLFNSTLDAIQAGGGRVDLVTALFGSNDLIYLTQTPAFQAADAAGKQAMVTSLFGTIQGNYLTLLTELSTRLPGTTVLLPGYYNPFAPLVAIDPSYAMYDPIIKNFNQMIAADAAAFGMTYVDIYTPFLGKEALLTNILAGDYHPNAAGYAVIARQLEAAVPAPEPASVFGLGLGAGSFAAVRLVRRRRARAA